jgi:hypothetical protein
MKVLEIRWQRLVDEGGSTCPRCGETGAELREAARLLDRALRPVGVEVRLVEAVLTPDEFARDPLRSNRVFLGGKALEDWIPAEVGQSRCCSACGDSDCRTVSVEGTTYETIPSSLIVRAGLAAASRLLGAPTAPSSPGMEGGTGSSCCAPSPGRGASSSACCSPAPEKDRPPSPCRPPRSGG